MKKHKIFYLFTISLLASLSSLMGQVRVREEVKFPDILGYRTLKCDFHTHTVFSDGNVWPSVRAEEAWREGLDAIAITDHIEYLPHKDDINIGFNRSHEIAKPHGDALRVTVIRGAEITREMPPGHCNGIFLDDVEKLNVEDSRETFKAASEQGAFIFWNHPGWGGQQEDGIAKWYDEHTELVEKGWLHGIEVVNTREYYPEAHQWCLEKNLTMLSNSDIHQPINLDYHIHQGDHRAVTLVFAKDNSEASIKEALFDRRTVVYSGNMLVGEEKYMKPLFENSTILDDNYVELRGREVTYLQIRNTSEVDYELKKLSKEMAEITVPSDITLYGGKTVLFSIRSKLENFSGTREFEILYMVENLKVRPNEGLPTKIVIKVSFAP